MLAAAGASDLTLQYNVEAGNEVDEQTAVLIQQQVAPAGITVNIQKVDPAAAKSTEFHTAALPAAKALGSSAQVRSLLTSWASGTPKDKQRTTTLMMAAGQYHPGPKRARSKPGRTPPLTRGHATRFRDKSASSTIESTSNGQLNLTACQ